MAEARTSDDAAMDQAMAMAQKALAAGDLPVGAALVIGGELAGVAHNTIGSNKTLVAHAEITLLLRHGGAIMAHWMKGGSDVALFTTLEPCLMCLSASAHSRVSRVVYACRDTIAGAASHGVPMPWYSPVWPRIEHTATREVDSAKLLLRYMEKRQGWDEMRRMLLDIAGET
jgi:tRNA(adenine34) deaminase